MKPILISDDDTVVFNYIIYDDGKYRYHLEDFYCADGDIECNEFIEVSQVLYHDYDTGMIIFHRRFLGYIVHDSL